MIGLNGKYLSAAAIGDMRITAMGQGAYDLLGTFSWLVKSTQAAILSAFGAEGAGVIQATNAYLNGLATTNREKAQRLANCINEDPMLAYYIIQGNCTSYLNAVDGLNDGEWVDRFNPAIRWIPQGNCTFTGDGFTLSNTNNAVMYFADGNQYDLGNHFIVLVEFTAEIDAIGIDFGSVTMASKNTSFQAANGVAEMNWKMQGNNSNPGVKLNYPTMSAGRHYLTWEIRDAGNGYDFFRFTIDRVAYETSGIIPKATNFGGYKNWDIKNFYMARGVAGTQYCPTGGTIHKMLTITLE